MLFFGSNLEQLTKVSKNTYKLGQSLSTLDKNALFLIKMRFYEKLDQL